MRRRSRWHGENDIPIVVFSIREKGGLAAVLAGDGPFTVISD